MKLSYQKTADISTDVVQKTITKLETEIKKIQQLYGQSYAEAAWYQFAFQAYDQKILTDAMNLAKSKRQRNPALIVLVGIGGSSLGTLAVHEALAQSTVPFLCADTIDSELTEDIFRAVEQTLQEGEEVLMIVVSKSGTTTETIANAAVLVELLKKYNPKNYHEQVVIITDQDSPLYQRAEKQSYASLTIPQQLGGRFSVFSAAGLFPLALLGIDVENLCAGARAASTDCVKLDQDNPAAVSAAILYEQYRAGKHIHDTFLFAPYLAQLGGWYRQLMGESIGKRHNKQGAEVLVGMTPTVSIGSNDLHSVAQLYLAGPYDKITTFVSVQATSAVSIPKNEFSEVIPAVAGKTISAVQQAIFEGTCAAYAHDKRPFMSIELAGYTAYEIGYFMQMKMFEIVYLGFLLDINVFDQPQVELYKQETRRLLGS